MAENKEVSQTQVLESLFYIKSCSKTAQQLTRVKALRKMFISLRLYLLKKLLIKNKRFYKLILLKKNLKKKLTVLFKKIIKMFLKKKMSTKQRDT